MNHLPEDIATALESSRRRRPDVVLDVRWLPSVTSTMDIAAALASDDAPAGIVVCADEQTAGRGRRGRTWQSPPGAGLYFSLLSRPRLNARALPLVTLAAGVGVRDGLERATGLSTDLKWPNDVLVGRGKLAGILTEGSALGSQDQAVIIGIGVNLRRASYPPEVAARATSLEEELGRSVDRGHVLAELLRSLVDSVAAVERDRDGILQAWRRSASSAVGAQVEWTDAGTTKRGITAGIDDTGALLIDTGNRRECVFAGEVTWLTGGQSNRE